MGITTKKFNVRLVSSKNKTRAIIYNITNHTTMFTRKHVKKSLNAWADLP